MGIRIGIIGTGFAEKVQLPALRHVEGARVVAVASGHRENAERAAAAFGIPRVCEGWEELVALDDVDLVVVSSPPHTHAPAAIAALEAGRHVLCEKPMALKRKLFDEKGVREYWLVDPKGRRVSVCRRGADGSFPIVANLEAVSGDRLTTPLLPEFEWPMTDLFSEI